MRPVLFSLCSPGRSSTVVWERKYSLGCCAISLRVWHWLNEGQSVLLFAHMRWWWLQVLVPNMHMTMNTRSNIFRANSLLLYRELLPLQSRLCCQLIDDSDLSLSHSFIFFVRLKLQHYKCQQGLTPQPHNILSNVNFCTSFSKHGHLLTERILWNIHMQYEGS